MHEDHLPIPGFLIGANDGLKRSRRHIGIPFKKNRIDRRSPTLKASAMRWFI
jgi:hypothetical protein